MRKWYYVLLLFVACAKENIATEEDIAIFGIWETNTTPSIRAVALKGDNFTPIPGQEFEVVFPDGETSLFEFINTEYVSVSQRTPQPGEALTLNWYRDEDTASVLVIMPPAIENLSVTNDTLQSTGQEECDIAWSAPGGSYEFAAKLECLELIPQPLPWSPGTFMQLYNGPQIATQLTLQPSNFSCFGSHELTISMLNDQLRDAFFFSLSDIRGLLKQGPDNVSGGKGFVSGISTKRIRIEIE